MAPEVGCHDVAGPVGHREHAVPDSAGPAESVEQQQQRSVRITLMVLDVKFGRFDSSALRHDANGTQPR